MPFLGKLHKVKIEPNEVGYKTGEEYRLTKPLRYHWAEQDINVYAEAGAINNGASIPTIIPDILLNDHGRIDKPAVLHDDIYHAYLTLSGKARQIWESNHGIWTRKEADALLKDSAKDEGINFIRRWVIWSGVRLNVIAGRKWGKS
jgi:hypothetical protein